VADLLALRGLRLEREGPDGVRRVLDGLDLDLAAGERLALVGGNGAGKSSLLRYLATPGTLPDLRVGLVFQEPDEQLVAGSVLEELLLGRGGDPAAVAAAGADALARAGLAGREGDDPRLLSAGQKQRLQLAAVLAGEPDLLLLDEPTSLQDAAQAAWLREQLTAWPGAMIWATQDPAEVALCHRALVLDAGRPVAAGPPAAVLADAAVRELLVTADPFAAGPEGSFGEPPVGAPASRPPAAPDAEAPPLAALHDVVCHFPDGGRLEVAARTIAAGERLGIVGPNGCGKSTLLAVLAGLRRPDRGTVILVGRRLYAGRARDLDHGACALAPQLPEYLFTRPSVAAEVALDPALARQDPASVLATAGLGVELLPRNPHDLSGGQRRRLALALALAADRPLILLDEPTAALDAAGRRLVAAQVRAAPPGAAVIIASHDLAFLDACGCRRWDLAVGAAAGLHRG